MYAQLKVTVLLKRNLNYRDVQEQIGRWLHQSQLRNDNLKAAHHINMFKGYVFNSLTPLEKDGMYVKARLYMFSIRSPHATILKDLWKCMKSTRNTSSFTFISSEFRQHKTYDRPIIEMRTQTPVIATTKDNRPWLPENEIDWLLERIHSNAEKKWRHFFPNEPQDNVQPFVQSIQIDNRKPFALGYKGKTMLGNKLTLTIHTDPYSQRLAQVALGAGLLEKNAVLGCGYCVYRLA